MRIARKLGPLERLTTIPTVKDNLTQSTWAMEISFFVGREFPLPAAMPTRAVADPAGNIQSYEALATANGFSAQLEAE